MKTSNITVTLWTKGGKTLRKGRGVLCYPFVVHRDINQDTDDSLHTHGHWVITHMATGRCTFNARTLKDAQKIVNILSKYPVFKMPDVAAFLSICKELGPKVTDELVEAGYDPYTLSFPDEVVNDN
tara:strand:- start:88 stop:465 length:378 start_codon:yes stop_codon:yes gene_type:complete